MKRVLFVLSGLAYSGAELVLEEYIKDNNEIEPYFLVLYENEVFKKTLDTRYVSYEKFYLDLKQSKTSLRYVPFIESIRCLKGLSKAIKTFDIDVIYANNTIETMIIGLLSDQIHKPVIGHVHDMKLSIKSPIRIMFTEIALKKVDQALTVSKACAGQWNANMEVVYNGVSSAIEKTTEYSSNIKRIGYIGTLSYRKGFDNFLQLIERVSEEDKSVSFYVAYSYAQDEKLEQQLLTLSQKYDVSVYKQLNAQQIANFYKTCDVIVVPSIADPLPTVVIEAIKSGVLVIGSCVDGIPEMLQYNELLLFEPTVDAMYNTLQSVQNLDEDKRHKLIVKLQKYADEMFNSHQKMMTINAILSRVGDKK